MTQVDPVVAERRILIQYILQEKVDQGVEILLPVGCNSFDDWLLDALDVDKLIDYVKTRKKIDLIDICDPENARPVSRRTTVNTVVDAVDNGGMDVGGDGAMSLPRLGISYLSSQMEDQNLRDVAFEIFVDCCGKSASSDLLQSVRGQLEISEKRGQNLKDVLARVRKKEKTPLSTIESHLKLLGVVSPSDFENFRSYMAWRDGTCMLIQLTLIHNVQTSWNTDDSSNAHYLMAVMKGAFRRLDARDADDYDEKEMKDAVAAVSAVCSDIASRCQSGAEIPWDLKASIAEVLLRGSFDSLDEGSLIDEVDELDELLRKKVWPLLGITNEIHSALQVWANYRQFYISKEPMFLERACEMAGLAGSAGDARTQESAALVGEIMEGIQRECTRVLGDYHNLCSGPREVSSVIQLLVAINKRTKEKGNLAETLSSLVKSSVTEQYERKAAEIGNHAPSEQDRVALIATECLELLRSECEDYSRMLQHYIPKSTGIAAAALHESYGARLLPWIVSIRSLDKRVIEILSTAMDLEDQLLLEMQQHGMAAPEWGVIDRITPQLYEWTKGQLRTLQEWNDRIISTESWKSVSNARGACGSSVGEILKASTDVVESLFMMGIPIPPGVVRCMVDGVDGILQKYCDSISAPLLSVDDIIPPDPPLTRYKKDVVDAAQQIDRGSGDAQTPPGSVEKSPSSMKNITAKVGSVFTSSWLPNLTNDQKQQILGVPFSSLAIRANSLSRVAEGMTKMGDIVVQKWESGQPKSASAKLHMQTMEWASGMFQGVLGKAANDVDIVLHFIAIKLLCGHLREQVFSKLYRYNVQAQRIHPILREIDASLGDMCEILNESLAARLAGHFCKALNMAVTHVLLDGGPVRWFSMSDVQTLQEDMEAMAGMFHADGDGLDKISIEKLMKSSLETINLMDTDTGRLISMLKEAKKRPLASDGSLASDPEAIMKVLCHRKDHAASKYLKKEYKIQKKLPNIITSSMSKSFSK